MEMPLNLIQCTSLSRWGKLEMWQFYDQKKATKQVRGRENTCEFPHGPRGHSLHGLSLRCRHKAVKEDAVSLALSSPSPPKSPISQND